jgi:glycosyltransferase involved in cell wall biosynthesis
MAAVLKYALITPARDEVQFIELAIKSVTAQKIRPVKWVIVSDGSTDGTDEIVRKYSAEYPWIELVRMPEHSERNFAGKVHAFNAGYARLDKLHYDAIASMDADISFDSEYFSFLLGKLAGDPRLGLVGTPFQNASNETYDYRFTSIEHGHRSGCSDGREDEGLEDAYFHGEGVHAPSRAGNGPGRRTSREVQARCQGLRVWRPSTLGVV